MTFAVVVTRRLASPLGLSSLFSPLACPKFQRDTARNHHRPLRDDYARAALLVWEIVEAEVAWGDVEALYSAWRVLACSDERVLYTKYSNRWARRERAGVTNATSC